MIVLFISAMPPLVKIQDKTLQRTSCSPFVFDCRTGGIIPTVAQRLHRENIGRVVQEAMERSGITQSQLSAVATTVKPGLALSLGIGLDFSLNFVKLHQKPFIPIHHMEAHALMVRMLQPVVFPFLVSMVTLLALAQGISDFLLLGQTLDDAPGDTIDKVMSLPLRKHLSEAGGFSWP